MESSFIIKSMEDLLRFIPGHIYWKDANGVYMGCNQAQANFNGLDSPQSIIGKTDFDILSNKDAKLIIENDKKIVSSRKGSIIEEVVLSPGGEKKVFLSYKNPIINEQDIVVGIFGISLDITGFNVERQVSYLELQLTLDAVINEIPDHVYWLSLDNKILGCNLEQAKTFGASSPDDIIGRDLYDFQSKRDADAIAKLNKIVASQERTISAEEPYLDRFGNKKTFFSKKSPLRDRSGKVVGTIGVSYDITKQKAAQIAKDEFISNMSHDIRTPISGIIGSSEKILSLSDRIRSQVVACETGNKPRNDLSPIIDSANNIAEASESLKKSGKGLLKLCNEILDFVKHENPSEAEESKPLKLRNTIDSVIGLLYPSIENKSLALKVDIDPEIPTWISGFPGLLNRSLINLTNNAIKFTSKGSIHISAKLVKELSKTNHVMVDLIVKDTGIGFPESDYKTIFDKFSRLTPSYKGTYEGSGLGLYMVKKHVETMGGEISVESEVGVGSCFTARIPFQLVSQDEIDALGAEELKNTDAEVLPDTHSQLHRILLVEDNEVVAKTVSFTLEELGCQIDIATSGTEAVQKAKQGLYGLVIMDIGLPDFSGIEATRRIRALDDSNLAQVPIVALTGHANNPEKRAEALDAGMQEVLSKPAFKEDLAHVINQYASSENNPAENKNQLASDVLRSNVLILDWDRALATLPGEEHDAQEMLMMCHADIVKTKARLLGLYAQGDMQAMRDELHRVKGMIAYFPVPAIEATLRDLHQALKNENTTDAQRSALLDKAVEAMDAFDHLIESALIDSREK